MKRLLPIAFTTLATAATIVFGDDAQAHPIYLHSHASRIMKLGNPIPARVGKAPKWEFYPFPAFGLKGGSALFDFAADSTCWKFEWKSDSISSDEFNRLVEQLKLVLGPPESDLPDQGSIEYPADTELNSFTIHHPRIVSWGDQDHTQYIEYLLGQARYAEFIDQNFIESGEGNKRPPFQLPPVIQYLEQ